MYPHGDRYVPEGNPPYPDYDPRYDPRPAVPRYDDPRVDGPRHAAPERGDTAQRPAPQHQPPYDPARHDQTPYGQLPYSHAPYGQEPAAYQPPRLQDPPLYGQAPLSQEPPPYQDHVPFTLEPRPFYPPTAPFPDPPDTYHNLRRPTAEELRPAYGDNRTSYAPDLGSYQDQRRAPDDPWGPGPQAGFVDQWHPAHELPPLPPAPTQYPQRSSAFQDIRPRNLDPLPPFPDERPFATQSGVYGRPEPGPGQQVLPGGQPAVIDQPRQPPPFFEQRALPVGQSGVHDRRALPPSPSGFHDQAPVLRDDPQPGYAQQPPHVDQWAPLPTTDTRLAGARPDDRMLNNFFFEEPADAGHRGGAGPPGQAYGSPAPGQVYGSPPAPGQVYGSEGQDGSAGPAGGYGAPGPAGGYGAPGPASGPGPADAGWSPAWGGGQAPGAAPPPPATGPPPLSQRDHGLATPRLPARRSPLGIAGDLMAGLAALLVCGLAFLPFVGYTDPKFADAVNRLGRATEWSVLSPHTYMAPLSWFVVLAAFAVFVLSVGKLLTRRAPGMLTMTGVQVRFVLAFLPALLLGCYTLGFTLWSKQVSFGSEEKVVTIGTETLDATLSVLPAGYALVGVSVVLLVGALLGLFGIDRPAPEHPADVAARRTGYPRPADYPRPTEQERQAEYQGAPPPAQSGVYGRPAEPHPQAPASGPPHGGYEPARNGHHNGHGPPPFADAYPQHAPWQDAQPAPPWQDAQPGPHPQGLPPGQPVPAQPHYGQAPPPGGPYGAPPPDPYAQPGPYDQPPNGVVHYVQPGTYGEPPHDQHGVVYGRPPAY